MKQVSIIGIIFTIGILIFLKIFLDSIPRVNEPITNIFVFVGFVFIAIIYGMSRIKKNNEHTLEK
ncbi:hypothetical protein ACZ11_09630 [Lysinibacillus xylanilyticus]|uniref:Uncharacterized protein n=1 Tax=Lysinibacillus xylanilyticus TaxID=582475 RepID=A0A0K9FE09_9BACI|nr:hypothetical protein [Lysinibacillus xylanilyticus]KMY32381.1 hypothetical protein ACZ11_09630 [Lysinibacillus xylanilyticus]